MEEEEGLKRCKVNGGDGEFDQLCYFLKMSWNLSKTESGKIEWVLEKLRVEPRRIFMIETFANLLDTKQSSIAQLHRYLYLGVLNFKKC